MANGLIIDTGGQTVTVLITSVGAGATISLYSDVNAINPLTNPMTISATTKVFVRETVQTLVSLKIDGTEYATAAGTALPYTFEDGSVGSCAPVPTSELAQSAGGTNVAQVLKPEAFGAPLVYAGGYDDTSAVQACITAALATNSIVELSRVYNVDHISGTGRLLMKGHGGNDGTGALLTGLLITQGSADGLALTSAPGSKLRDLGVKCNVTTPTAGALVRFLGTGSGDFVRMQDVDVLNAFDGIRFEDGCYYKIVGCDVLDPVNFGMFFSTNSGERADHGDQIVTGCTISGMYVASRNGVSAVRWESGGGLRFLSNKINGGEQPSSASVGKFATGVDIQIADGVSTSVMVFSANSIENCTSACIDAKQKGPSNTGSLGKITVVGNEFLGTATGVAIHPAGSNPNWNNSLIADNLFTGVTTSMLLDNISRCHVGTNVHDVATGATLISVPTTGITNFRFDPQVHTVDSITLFNNPLATSSTAKASQNGFREARELGSITSNATYTVLHRITVPQYGAGMLKVTIVGNLNGVGACLYDNTVAYTRATAAVTATPGTATTAGGTVNVQYDTATVSGEIQIGVKLASGSGPLLGRITVQCDGNVSTLKKGA